MDVTNGADLPLRDSKGRTGLYHAAERGRTGVVKLMLEEGGKELGMMVDVTGRSCAHAAAQNGHVDVVEIL
jgi:ankyrin repeat protein